MFWHVWVEQNSFLCFVQCWNVKWHHSALKNAQSVSLVWLLNTAVTKLFLKAITPNCRSEMLKSERWRGHQSDLGLTWGSKEGEGKRERERGWIKQPLSPPEKKSTVSWPLPVPPWFLYFLTSVWVGPFRSLTGETGEASLCAETPQQPVMRPSRFLTQIISSRLIRNISVSQTPSNTHIRVCQCSHGNVWILHHKHQPVSVITVNITSVKRLAVDIFSAARNSTKPNTTTSLSK